MSRFTSDHSRYQEVLTYREYRVAFLCIEIAYGGSKDSFRSHNCDFPLLTCSRRAIVRVTSAQT